MKQKPLTVEERNILVAYRIQRAKETLAEADNMIKDNFYNAAVNRLYYTCYYAVMLVKNDISARTHQGALQMFSLHFIVNNKISEQYSTFYGKLFNSRISGDYDDFVRYDNEMLTALRPQAEEFIVVIENELNNL